jgi:hypothetical protein
MRQPVTPISCNRDPELFPLTRLPRRAVYQDGLPQQHLPFTVRTVRTADDLAKAVMIRHAAYNRHVPDVARTLAAPEALDSDPGTIVLLAESKLDGSPLGTMRIQTNRGRPLALEASVELPDWLQGQRLAEATRLGVAETRIGRIVKTVLFKAYFQYCLVNDINWLVIAARSPLDRQYEALLFSDVFDEDQFIPMAHAGNIPHRVLAFDVLSAEERWQDATHPLLDFMCATHHPDILVNHEFSRNAALPQASQTTHSNMPKVILS